MGNPEGIVEGVIISKKTTIARNKADGQAFMNNAPVDNFGTKEYQYVSSKLQGDAYFLWES
jgi:hypothetical protein